MNELKKISIVWGLLLIIIFVLLTVFSLKWKNKYQPYFDLEKTLVTKTKSYYETDHSYPANGSSEFISTDELINNEVIEDLKVKEDECTGYIKVSNTGVIKYNAYIKCNNYTTKDYDKYNNE